jgi:signal transduction histidine kinase
MDSLRTVSVPDAFAPVFLRAQEYVRRYFAERSEDPETASVAIAGERYILVRAASMSVEFFDLVMSLYADQGAEAATNVARNLLYDIAHSLGKADARAFGAKMNVVDPIERLSAGPIHFSYAGWAFVRIHPDSHPEPGDGYYLLYDHPYSFESDAWVRHGRRATFPVCWMSAGFSSGWCAESFGLPLVAAEVECRARGDAHCRFVMAPPGRIEEYLARYAAAQPNAESAHRASGDAAVTVPEYFQRKRMEDALRRANEDLERRVAERTAQLEAANRALQAEMVERELAEEERQRMQVKLLHGQKLESLGVMSGGIAHDFNNLLVGILGNAGLVLQELAPDAPLRKAIEEIENSALRAAELTHQLLAYAGKGQFVTGPVHLSRLVEEMEHLLTTAVGRMATLVYEFDEQLPVIDADAAQLRQVVMNLVTNAAEAMGSAKGRIVVRTGVMHADRAYLAESQAATGATEGAYAFLEVQDDGHGMHAATQARIFDPFFTTKFTGRGLGLAAVLGIARAHRGAIRLTSAAGRGTTIRVLLPLIESAAPAPARRRSPVAGMPSPEEAGSVLVVDDEETVRSVAAKVLERHGFSVLTASGGVEAMRMLRAAPEAVDLVVLDMTMPDMSGPVTLQELLRIKPTLKVLMSSGYAVEDAIPHTDAAVGFIQKPYRPAELVRAVRHALA